MSESVAKDVCMGSDGERSGFVFGRDVAGRVASLIERRKFNDP